MPPPGVGAFSADALFPILQQLPPPQGYLLALSGGLDSSVLLHALAVLRERLSAPLTALHVNHGLQLQAPDWVKHCQALCATLGVPLQVRDLNLQPQVGDSIEAVARTARRLAYQQTLAPGACLLTGQHQDDQAETLLLQLLRGAGVAGLAAMPRFTTLPPGYLARPLLDFSRAQLRAYADRYGLAWVEDPSNAVTDFDRNYLRHRVLPQITARWPAYAATLSRSAQHCAEAQALLEQWTQTVWEQVRGSRPGSLAVNALMRLEPAHCRAVLRQWIRTAGYRVPDQRRLERIIREVLPAAADRQPQVEWTGAQVRRYRNDLFLLPALPPLPGNVTLAWPAGCDNCTLPEGLGQLRRVAAVACIPENAVTVRFGVTGARCRLPGTVHRRRIAQLFQEHGVPDWLRPYVPLVYRHDTLLAVVGIAQCAGAQQSWVWEQHPFATLLPV